MRWGLKLQLVSNILSTFPMIDFFLKISTFKIQDQSYSSRSHSRYNISRSHSRYNILSTHISFVPCWFPPPPPPPPFQSHNVAPFCSKCQFGLPFRKYSIFKIWPWKSRVKVRWPSSAYPDMDSPQSDPCAAWFGKFLDHNKWTNNYDAAQLQFYTIRTNFKGDISI